MATPPAPAILHGTESPVEAKDLALANDIRLVGDLMYTALNGVPTAVEYRGTPVRAGNSRADAFTSATAVAGKIRSRPQRG